MNSGHINWSCPPERQVCWGVGQILEGHGPQLIPLLKGIKPLRALDAWGLRISIQRGMLLGVTYGV